MTFHNPNAAQKLTKEASGIRNSHKLQEPALQNGSKHAQLRRLPHVFCKYLDLPFPAETRVAIDERRDAYAFIIQQPGLQQADVVAEAVEIVPGSIKVILRGADRIRAELTKSRSAETVNWRARLPMGTIPERAKATYAHGIITITIPKLPVASKPSRCPSEDLTRRLACLV